MASIWARTCSAGPVSYTHLNIGFLLIKAGGALIDNMAWLFVIGVAVGLSDDREGTSALAGLVSWLMMTNLLSTGVVTTLMQMCIRDRCNACRFSFRAVLGARGYRIPCSFRYG